ncbi:NADH dehydrogenase subunit G [Mycobacterium tuberculosis CAS/NITR204]|uniref:NADH-quinone oxidoreductase subunit G n=1 Tax=Mycobacterium tuberculosis CAS/NITR204 TaxID=1310114 RepID=R4MM88_MYCTX|nr:NADH dehydrogenase subunit G [Mycobacterium tuberculosis CAS/NITR204]
MTQAADTDIRVGQPEMVTLTIDGVEISVPKGTLVIRAAELMGIQIPRFCDHPLLEPVGACRQCLVEVEGQRKPLASCTTVATDDMVVRTQLTSEIADKAQHGVMELLLINHPLDCPMCDKGGECPLQNQAMSNGRTDSRFTEAKRTFAKPINISAQVLLDRERCILCARCTRFSDQIAGDPFIDMQERGALQQVGIYADEPFESYFSGNTVQICPVGALTGTAYRFRARPFDLVSSPSVCEHCASGCAQRTDHRRGKVLRRLAGDDPEVNEEWNCDKGRWAFTYATQPDVITTPLIRDGGDPKGALVPTSWSHAMAVAAQALEAGPHRGAGRRPSDLGGRLRVRQVRADHVGHQRHRLPRPAALGRGGRLPGGPHRRAAYGGQLCRFGIGSGGAAGGIRARRRVADRVSAVTQGRSQTPRPGVHDRPLCHWWPAQNVGPADQNRSWWRTRGAGRSGHRCSGRPAGHPGRGHHSRGALGHGTGRIVGGRSAGRYDRRPFGVGAAAGGGTRSAGSRSVAHAVTRWPPAAVDRPRAGGAAWHIAELPAAAGRDADGILAAAADETLAALLVGGIEPADFADPDAVLAALDATGFVVSLELRHSTVTERADVVFPVAPTTQKAGAFVNWEGRYRTFEPALRGSTLQAGQSDHRVLDALADDMGVHLGVPTVEAAREELAALGIWDGKHAAGPHSRPPGRPNPKLVRRS